MPKVTTIRGWVKRAKYYPVERSILVAMEEIESRRPMKPIQVSVNTFIRMEPSTASLGQEDMTKLQNDHEFWQSYASRLERRTTPLAIEFAGDKTEQDPI
jgi:hypothetical protein